MTATWVLAAEWIVPVEGAPLRQGWLVVDSGSIAEIGQGPTPTNRGPVFDVGRAAVIPAFVNAHTHLACQFLKDQDRDLDFPHWLQSGVAPRVIEAARGDAEGLHRAASTAVEELLQSGVGTVADGFFHEAGLEALQAAGLRGFFFREYFGSMSEDLEEYAARAAEQIRADSTMNRGDSLIRTGVAPHALYSCPPEVLQVVVRTAREQEMLISMHVAESREESEFFAQRRGALHEGFAEGRPDDRYRYGASPVQVLESLDLLGPDFLAVHAVQLDDKDIATLARHRVSVVHCPGSNLTLAVGTAPIRALEEAGVECALGTDSGASRGKLDMFEEMRLSILLPRAGAQPPETRPRETKGSDADRALHRATLTGARVLGLDNETGSLKVGKSADLCVVGLDRPRHRYYADPVSALVWAGTVDDVQATVVAGRVLSGSLDS